MKWFLCEEITYKQHMVLLFYLGVSLSPPLSSGYLSGLVSLPHSSFVYPRVNTHTHRVSRIKKPLDKQRNLRSAFPRQVRDVSGSISTVLIFKLLHFFHLSSTSNLPPTLRTQGMFHTFSSKLCHFMPLCIAAEQVTHICATASREEVAAYSALT